MRSVPSIGSPAGTSGDRAGDSVCTLSTAVQAAGPITCSHCGASFTPRRLRKDVRFCQPACRAAWHNARRAALFDELKEALSRAAVIVAALRR